MMTNKQVGFLALTLILCASLFAFAQSPNGIVMLGTQTALSGCAWPTSFATVTNGMAVCPLNLSGQPAMAIAINGGAFQQVPMGTAAAGVTSFNGRTGAVTLTKADVLAVGITATATATPPTTTATSTAPAVTVTLQ